MGFSTINKKLGNSVISYSREVGTTCPTCPLLNNGCYANRMQGFRTNIRKAYENNLILDTKDAYKNIVYALQHNMIVRLHVAGDFFYNNDIDLQYLMAWNNVLTNVKLRYKQLPRIFFYTHVYDKRIVKFFAGFEEVTTYASIHSQENLDTARKAGFTLFAFASEVITQKSQKKQKVPVKLEVIEGEGAWLVCPEQRKAYDGTQITCSTCKYCVTGKGNVVFLKH